MAERRKARPLRPGGLIAVPTPASPLLDVAYLESGVAWLEERGPVECFLDPRRGVFWIVVEAPRRDESRLVRRR